MTTRKPCANCGQMRRVMFTCDRCGKRIGLCCYIFDYKVKGYGLCISCTENDIRYQYREDDRRPVSI